MVRAAENRNMRKFLKTLQPSSDGKENLVGAGRTLQDVAVDNRTVKPDQVFSKVEISVKDSNESFSIAQVNASQYKKLIIEDLTTTAGPSQKYWEVIAERRRKALEEVLKENQRLHTIVTTLEEENMSCKKLIEETTDLVNTLKEIINESQCSDDNNENHEDSGLNSPNSSSSEEHINKKMKTSTSDSFSDVDSEY